MQSCLMLHEQLTHEIIGLAMKVHRTLGPGFLESVYHKALAHELSKADLSFEKEFPLDVMYDGIRVGHFVADLFVEDQVIVELKAVLSLTPSHTAQLVNYLTATGTEIGLLFNFGGTSLEFNRKHRTYKPAQSQS